MLEAPTEKLVSDAEIVDVPKDVQIIRPIGVDLFLSGTDKNTHLPSEVISNPKLIEQAAKRRELYGNIGRIFDQVKDVNMDIDTAISNGLVHAEEAAEIYEQFSDFIEADENNTRVVLYLPFQLLPNLYGRNKPDRLAKAQVRFKDIYRNAWIRLLHESEPRASFVDGDVLEPGLGKPERIRKAGHLTPEILQRGLIDTQDIIDLLDISKKEELLRSLTEGVVVAKDKHLIDDIDWRAIQGIGRDKQAVNEVLQMIKSAKKEHPSKQVLGIDEIVNRLDGDLEGIENQYVLSSSYASNMSTKRAKWEKSVKQDEAIDNVASELSSRLQREEIGIVDIENCCNRNGHTGEYSKAGIRGIAKAAEAYANIDLEKAKGFAKQYQELIQKLWDSGSVGVKDEIVSALSHFRRLNIIQDEDLQKLGISLLDLSSPFPVNLEELAKTDLQEIIEVVKNIKSHSALSEKVYPLMLAFGSRLKGYAGLNADFDTAIFVKPTVPWEKREAMLQQLHEEIPEVKDLDKILEFWVEEKEGKLGFRTIPEGTETVVGAPQVHFLLGGVWISQENDYQRLYGDMIKKYLDLSRFGEQKDQVRNHLLGQIELDILQYRLMHKGYKRFYPSNRESGTEHANLIDWESDFWDPGYRRVATQLFLSRVFLPDLSPNLVKKGDESDDR